MPLIRETLYSGLAQTWGVSGGLYQPSSEAAIRVWKNSLLTYLSGLTPISTTVIASANQFELELGVATMYRSPTSHIQIARCFNNLALGVGLGMQPLFTSVPPTNFPIDIIMEAGKSIESREEGLDVWCDAIDTWFRTGTAVNNQSGVTVIWA